LTKQLGTSSTDYGNRVIVEFPDKLYITGKTSVGLEDNKQEGNGDNFHVKYNSEGVKQ